MISFKDKSFREALIYTKRLVWRKKYWWNRSTKVDYKVYLFNSVLKILLFIPFLDFSFRISRFVVKYLLKLNHGNMGGMIGTSANIFLFTVLAFCFDDFLRFFHHLLMHRIPWLWRFHVTHHSAKVLTPISLYRTHPLESAMATVRNSISTGVMIGLFIFLFESQFSLYTVLGVNFFGFSFNFLASNLRHSHIPITFGFMEHVFISPKQHQVHHSTNPAHYDKNFGVSLTIWDRLNRSLVYSKDVKTPLKFGLEGPSKRQSFRRLIFRP
jgi:sterol desaturase/sphingolipid hydroxylase (fatty acid hydroxylase superfamily)